MTTFPEDFVWGAAAASYQIEGAVDADGKGPSVWDKFCQRGGKIANEDSGEIACDHYHRYREDVKLMAEIGLEAYRFSICWPRILPAGRGKVNEKGLDFYDRLVDELLEGGIEPYITLFHWDYPYELYRRGGWLHPDSPEWFAEYTRVIMDRLSDRVDNWITLNEPQVYTLLGHKVGNHAPGLKLGMDEVLQVAHNSLLAHGRAAEVIRDAPGENRIGIAPCMAGPVPSTELAGREDLLAEEIFAVDNLWNVSWWIDPLVFGNYPADGRKKYAEIMPDVRPGDMELISGNLDFLGANIYYGPVLELNKRGEVEEGEYKTGITRTAFDWPITPESLYWGPKLLYNRYNLPIIVTENGMSNTDCVSLDGEVHDPQRIDFLHRYLSEYRRAAEHGVEIKGYFQWSIMDNFEWAEGYKERFGLIYVDYETGERIIKDSGYWYREVIETNGELLESR
ncbi:MAG: GH1 family beta-glucosidase [Halanaerobiaceae bacterium]